MKDSKAFGERLKDSLLRAGYELRPSVVEREFNQRYWGTPVTVQAVRKWLAGDVIPTQDKLQTLAEWLQIDPHWLRFGEERFGSIRAQEASWEVGMTQEDRDMISQFLALSLRERKVLRDFLTLILKQLNSFAWLGLSLLIYIKKIRGLLKRYRIVLLQTGSLFPIGCVTIGLCHI